MMHKDIVSAVALVTAFVASSAAHAVPLWGRVEAGMTFEQLRAAYPEARATLPRNTFVLAGHVEQFQNCPASASVVFVRGVVERVVLTGQPEPVWKCHRGIEKALTQNFGKPRRLGVLREWVHEGVRWLLNPYADPTAAIVEGPVSPQWSVSFSLPDK